MVKCTTILIGLLVLIELVSGAKILNILYAGSSNQKNLYNPLISALADRGHQMTVISPSKSSTHQNVKDIIGPQINLAEIGNFFEMRENGYKFINPMIQMELIERFCNAFYAIPAVVNMVKNNEKFDLVIVTPFMGECTYGLVSHLGSPYIIAELFGSKAVTSFSPTPFLDFLDELTFCERMTNTLINMGNLVLKTLYVNPRACAIYREQLGNFHPSSNEIERNASITLSNSHFSISFPKTTRDMVEIAGIHLKPTENQLPRDIEDFINGSGQTGFIYFSLGSVIDSSIMPENYRKMFLDVFKGLRPLRVLWKWEGKTMSDLPPNVMTLRWAPQQDILSHPKIRLFISQGGLMSMTESVHSGVPVLGIPFYGDQDWNLKTAIKKGFAQSMELSEINAEDMTARIVEMLNNPSYMDKARAVSNVFRDQIDTALYRTVYWVEYVLRHNGAKQMSSPAKDLNFIYYYSLDVFLVLGLAIWATSYGLCSIGRYVGVWYRNMKERRELENRYSRSDILKRIQNLPRSAPPPSKKDTKESKSKPKSKTSTPKTSPKTSPKASPKNTRTKSPSRKKRN